MSPAARRAAPAVRFAVRRSRAAGGLLAAGVVAAAAVLLAWLFLGTDRNPATAVAGGALWLVAAVCAWHWWLGQFCGELCWDGQRWALDPVAPGRNPLWLKGAPEVQLDLQDHLWLHVRGDAGKSCIWLWLEARWQPERWVDLRRAVYSRAGTGTPSAGEFAPIHSREA